MVPVDGNFSKRQSKKAIMTNSHPVKMLILCCALSGGQVSLWEPGVGVCHRIVINSILWSMRTPFSERGQPCHNSMNSIQFKMFYLVSNYLAH